MLLRTRISLLMMLTIGVVSVSIVTVGLQREALIKDQYSRSSVSDQTNLWNKIMDEIIRRMEAGYTRISENELLIDAIANRDSVGIQQLATESFSQLQSQNVLERLDLVYEDGSLAYSSLPSVFQSPIISPNIAQNHIANNQVAKGIGTDAERNTGLVYGFPLFDRTGTPIAMAIFSIDILSAIQEMERLANSTVVLVNWRGRLIASTEGTLWGSLQKSVDLRKLDAVQTIHMEDKFYSITVLPQVAELSGLVGRTLMIKDVTELTTRQIVISQYYAVVVAFLVIFLVFCLYYYMSRSFSPLAQSVGVLNALSKGDLQVQVEEADSNNEVGQISNAINRFRADLISLNRFRRSRERQAARQKRFIIREMSVLSEMLDGEERERVLQELQRLKDIVQESPTQTYGQARTKTTAEVGSADNEIHEMDSLAPMAIAFQHMSNRIQDQHGKLRDSIRTKQALASIQKELDIATRVQYSLIPSNLSLSGLFPAAGYMTPAKEVGGDFFDLFRLDRTRIGVAVADVSGKGVPAALFMVMARTLLRSTVFHIESPAAVLSYMNEFLEQNNDEQLFITMFYGILDEEKGTLTYSTGGHNPPIVSDSKGARVLEQTQGAILALIENLEYSEKTVDLEDGSRVVMMTDGIPEAFNADGEAFGDDRTLESIAALEFGQSPSEDVSALIRKVEDFVGDAPQFDDITCVILHYYSKSGKGRGWGVEGPDLELVLRNDLSEIPRIAGQISQYAEQQSWPKEWASNINLMLDELITNSVSYGQLSDGYDEIRITLNAEKNRLITTIEDGGLPFNPFEQAPIPDLEADIEDRPIGGLGIFFVKELTSSYEYQRINDKNRIVLVQEADGGQK